MIYFATCQYDRHGNRLLIREVALIPVNNPLKLYWWLVKVPIAYNELSDKDQQTAAYLQKYGHGLRWTDGFTSLEYLLHQLPIDVDLVICNGDQVRELLSSIFPHSTIVNAEVPSLTRNSTPFEHICCPFTHSHTFCAVANVYKLFACFFE